MTMKNKHAKSSRNSDHGVAVASKLALLCWRKLTTHQKYFRRHVAELLWPIIEFAADRKFGVDRTP